MQLNTFVAIPGGGGGAVLGISSDGDGRRFFGFEIFDAGSFLGMKIGQVFFFGSSSRDFSGVLKRIGSALAA